MGVSYNDVMILPISIGHDIIKKNSDDILNDRILQYRLHGIEPTNTKIMGTDYYKKYIDAQTLERDKEFVKQFDLKKRDEKTKNDFNNKMEELKKAANG